jgi:hypothetical protein
MASHRTFIAPILIGLSVLALSCLPLPRADAADALYAVGTRGASAVAVGDLGRILRAYPAPHNTNWISAGHTTNTTLRAVAAGGTDYFAVGDEGKILQSSDPAGQGMSWILQDAGTTLNLTGIAHGSSRMVAVGDSAAIFLSTNLEGGLWQRAAPANIATKKRLKGVAGNQYFVVAVGDSGTVIWSRSSTMLSWAKPSSIPTTHDLRFVASEPLGSTSPRFWAVGAGGAILLSSSTPGVAWTLQASPVSVDLNAVAIYRLLPDNVLIAVAVGDGGTILRSADTATWTQVDSGTQSNLYGVAYTGSGAGGGFVAVGEGNTILWSPTGLSWSNVLVPVQKTTWGATRAAWRTSGTDR